MDLIKKMISRREFLDKTSKATAGIIAGGALASCAAPAPKALVAGKVIGANDRINLAIIGIRGRGGGLLNSFAGIPNVHIKTICDVDERLFPKTLKSTQEKFGYTPGTEWDARKVYDSLKKEFVCQFDSSGSVGRRYARADEIGIPFCITFDFESLEDNCVTVRERDSTKQTRVAISELSNFIKTKI